MPYRRLPNTDQARIRTLKSAIGKGEIYNVHDLAFSLKTLTEAKNFLIRFEAAQIYYKQCFDNQIKSNGKYQAVLKTARLYISHFIQVLNLSVIRMEIREDLKKMYGLPVDSYNVPDLTNEIFVLEWGEKVVKGEKERLKKGGIPIYNPTIAKVCVHYDIFRESYERQKELQDITLRSLKVLSSMRENADKIILDIWDQIENKFSQLPAGEKLEKSKEYGIIFYYRKNEKENGTK